MRRLILLVMMLGCVSPGWAGGKIDLPQDNGTITPLGGIGSSARMTDGCSFTNYTSTGDKNVKSVPGELCGIFVSSGTSVTFAAYNDADGTCSSGAITGTVAASNGTYYKLPAQASVGLCVTVGGTSPNLTVFYK